MARLVLCARSPCTSSRTMPRMPSAPLPAPACHVRNSSCGSIANIRGSRAHRNYGPSITARLCFNTAVDKNHDEVALAASSSTKDATVVRECLHGQPNRYRHQRHALLRGGSQRSVLYRPIGSEQFMDSLSDSGKSGSTLYTLVRC